MSEYTKTDYKLSALFLACALLIATSNLQRVVILSTVILFTISWIVGNLISGLRWNYNMN